jgi:ACS family glucarate transporter-like MFS transporter
MGDPKSDGRAYDPLVQRPTAVRYGVLAFLVVMAVILYLDRVCISMAEDSIRDELGLSKKRMGVVFSAFFLAYALMQVPSGWLGDCFGARRMLVACVLVWSATTALTGLAAGFLVLLAVRLLFGVGQAGAYPVAARVNSLWMPFSQRAFASGLITLGGRAGGALAPALTAALILAWGDWRLVFWVYAVPGLVWAALFWLWFRDRPAEHPTCNEAECRLIAARHAETTNPAGTAASIPWSDVLRSTSLWMQCLTQFTSNIAWVFLITWLPTYLKEAHKQELAKTGWLASLPLLIGMTGCFLGGVTTDWLTRRVGLKWGRNLLGMTTKFVAALGAVLALRADNPSAAIVGLCLASFAVDLGLGATWAYFQDTGGPYVGTLLGWANMFGNFGAVVSPLLLGWFAEEYGWSTALAVCALLYYLAGLCWLGIDARIPIVRLEAGRSDTSPKR